MIEIESLKSKIPREFWKYFSKKKNSKGSNLSENDFGNYFKNLIDEINTTCDSESKDFCRKEFSTDDPIFEALDTVINITEMHRAIKHLKRAKAGSSNDLINEYFIEGEDIIASHLTDMLNHIFSSGHFPSSWMEGIIAPLFKKGDENVVDNYRGIALVSVL